MHFCIGGFVFSFTKIIIFANDMESKSFPFSFDIARRYAKHREHDYLYATANGGRLWMLQLRR